MNQKLIRDLRLRRVILKNEGNKDQLNQVLKEAFPHDDTCLGNSPFYEAAQENGSDYWRSCNNEKRQLKFVTVSEVLLSDENATASNQ